MEELPEDLMYVVFLNLQLKALTRFRSLSKRWNEIITSPAFAKDHMRTHNSSNNVLFTDTHLGTCHMVDIYETDEPEYGMTASRSCRLTKLQGGMPFRMSRKWRRTCRLRSSSCHGMLCMAAYDFNDHAATIYVWNPFTRKSKKVPWPVRKIQIYLEFRGSYLGFGYDHVADDYKIVVHMPSDPSTTTYTMSLKKAADDGNCRWRKVEDGCSWGYRIIGHDDEVPVNVGGSMYWIGSVITMPENNNAASKYWKSEMKYDTRYSFILKFNLVDEASEHVAPPAMENYPVPRWTTQIGKFKGCLCFFHLQCMIPEATAYDPALPFSCNIWIKHEDKLGGGEAKAIWSKFMNVPDVAPVGCRLFPFKYPMLAFSNKGDVILFRSDGYRWFWIYFQAEQRFLLVKNIEHGDQCEDGSNVHLLDMETLVSPVF